MRSRRAPALLLVALVAAFVNTGAGFAAVGDSVAAQSSDELSAHGASVLAENGTDIAAGRPALRLVRRAGVERVVVELGLMDVGFGFAEGQLERRVRAVLRDDLEGVDCVIWVDVKTTAVTSQPGWAERARTFNALLERVAADRGAHVARWSRFAEHHRDWFLGDGIHLKPRGERGFATWVAGRVDERC